MDNLSMYSYKLHITHYKTNIKPVSITPLAPYLKIFCEETAFRQIFLYIDLDRNRLYKYNYLLFKSLFNFLVTTLTPKVITLSKFHPFSVLFIV